MPNKQFTIDIHARDKTAGGISSAIRGLEKVTRHTPFEKVGRGLREVTEKYHALGSITRGLTTMGDAGSIAGAGIGEAAGGMDALGAAAGVAGLATAGVTAGLGMAALAAYKYEEGVTKGAAATGRFADEIGMSAQQLQAFELAGAKVGITAQAIGRRFAECRQHDAGGKGGGQSTRSISDEPARCPGSLPQERFGRRGARHDGPRKRPAGREDGGGHEQRTDSPAGRQPLWRGCRG